MTKELFIAQLERAALITQNLPVTSAMVRHLAAQLKKGEPAWWPRVLKAWAKRRFVNWTEAWGLFVACIHFEALSDADNPMVRYFPSCGGTAEADPSPALERFLAKAPESFFERLETGHRRVYVAPRSPLWIIPAALFFQRRRLPYYLVEANAGAGLDLAADIISPQKGFDSELVAARVGLDVEPLLLSDITQRRWLTAANPPEDMAAIQEMDTAADILLDKVSLDPSFVELAPCQAAQAARFIAKNIPAEEEMGLLILNMATTSRMTDEEYVAYQREMMATLAPWGDRALWVEVESVRGELYSTTFQLLLHRVQDSRPARQMAASIDFASSKVSFQMDETSKFLAA
jgi:hypothetical protein